MQKALPLLFFVTTSIAVLPATSPAVGQAGPSGSPQATHSEAILPVADYAQLTSAANAQSPTRQRTNDLFNGSHLVTSDPSLGGSQYGSLELGAGLSSIPVNRSDLIVMCRVVDARAFLAGDRGDVYSSYTLHVVEVLKADSSDIRTNGELEGIRYGGAVQYSNGVRAAFVVNDCEPLAIGTDYVLFLRYRAIGTYPLIQMAYAVTACGILAVDGNLGNDVSARSFNGTPVDDFMVAIRTRIATPTTPMPLNLPREPSSTRKLTSD